MGKFLDAMNSLDTPETQGAKPVQPQEMEQSNVAKQIEDHLNSIPDEQKQFLAQYLTPELAVIMGILLGEEAAQAFSQYVDPNLTLTAVPAQATTGEMGGQSQAAAPSQPSIGLAQGAAPVQGATSAPMMGQIKP